MTQRYALPLFFMLLWCASQANAQKDTSSIIYTKKFIQGSYYSFNELYQNRPANNTIYKPKVQLSGKYMLIDTVTGKKLEDAYGYCDGQNIYINCQQYNYDDNVFRNNGIRYVKMLEVGRYMFFIDEISSSFGGPPAVSMAVYIATHKDFGFIDANTGKIIPLNAKNFQKILSEYPDIQERYNRLEDDAKNNDAKLVVIRMINARVKRK